MNDTAGHEGNGHGLATFRLLFTAAFAIAMSVLVGVAVIQFRELLGGMGNWGYLGVFLAETANSAAVLVPTPSMAYTLTVASVLNPLMIGLIAGIGASLGEFVGYALGATGRQMLDGSRLKTYFEALAKRKVGAALFAFALLPVPFDIAGIWAGTVHYSPARFMLWVTSGKIIKFTGIAVAGHYGIGWILGFVS